MMNFAAARHNMVENQIRTNKVTHPGLLGALLELPRERFVPAEKQAIAYVDDDLDLGGGRYLMEPMVLARLIQLAEPTMNDVALVIGTASGYSAAVLGRLCAAVVAVESEAALAAKAARTLSDLAINNVAVHAGPLDAGWAAEAPYGIVIFDGAVERLPETIVDQLAEGGRLAAVVVEGGVGRGTLAIRRGGIVSRRPVFDAHVPVLPGFQAATPFAL